MAVFSKNTITQVSGFDNQCIAGELVYQQSTFWNGALEQLGLPVDLTGATIDAEIIRRRLENVRDTRYGLSFDIFNYEPTPDPIPLAITNLFSDEGKFTLVIDDSTWDLMAEDQGFDISSVNGIGFSGRIKISYPAQGLNPAQDLIVFLLFIIRSDGIINN